MRTARAAAVIAAAGAAALLSYPRLKRIVRAAPPGGAAAAAVIDADVERVRARIGEEYAGGMEPGFETAAGGRPRGLRTFKFFPAGDPMFPDDYQLRAWTARDPELRAYVALPASARSKDVYLVEVTGDYYWLSEYRYGGRAVPFRCAFIVHLEPAGAGRTRVEVLEYLPEVWAGEKLGWSGHGGPIPGFYHDIRVVAPTTMDRAAILRELAAASAR
jgi:hypothetical protein